MKIKNITSLSLTLPVSGIVLDAQEEREFSTIGTETFVSSCADEFASFFAIGKIEIIRDDETVITSITDVISVTSGLTSTLELGNLEELAIAIAPHANRRFIFLQDVATSQKDEIIKKPFPGSILSISIRPKKSSTMVQIYADGIYFQEEEIRRNAVFEYNFDYKMTDVVLILDSGRSKNQIELYMDGDTYLDPLSIQELVDSWREDSSTHSNIDKYMFDEQS